MEVRDDRLQDDIELPPCRLAACRLAPPIFAESHLFEKANYLGIKSLKGWRCK